MPDLTLIATVTIFIATYAVVAVGKVPVYRIDRAGAALLGGSLMLGIGVLTPQEAVLLLKPFVSNLEDAQRGWLIIAMAATFAGNFTLVGSVANLIVAQRAKARGVEIGFWAYFRVGAPLSLITIVIGLLLL